MANELSVANERACRDQLTRYDDWQGENDPGNPRNWSLWRKAISTLIVASIGFVCTLAAAIYAPGHDQVSAEMGISSTVALLPLSLYNLGLAFGPVISSPLSEAFGRKFVYLTTLPLFDIFGIGCGFSQSFAVLVACRFFSGVFAAPAVSVAAATITDYTWPSTRAVPLSAYYTIPFIGSTLGPLIGGFVVDQKGWRWTQWIVLFFAAVFHPPALFLRESYKQTLLQKRAKLAGSGGAVQHRRTLAQITSHFFRTTVIRPLHMLFTETTVGFVCLYTGFQFALLYTFVVACPYVFSITYDFSLGEQGLSFLGLVAGCCIAPACIILIDRRIYQPKLARVIEEHGSRGIGPGMTTLAPEERLYGAMIGSFILPTGLFWFAWTARPSIHWICPIIAEAVTILGSILVYVSLNLFMMDTYGAKYGASAGGASSLTRYTLSAAFPLFTLQFYRSVGIGWATSILGFGTVLMIPIPWTFYYWGPKLRARSAYEHGT